MINERTQFKVARGVEVRSAQARPLQVREMDVGLQQVRKVTRECQGLQLWHAYIQGVLLFQSGATPLRLFQVNLYVDHATYRTAIYPCKSSISPLVDPVRSMKRSLGRAQNE